ncbi:MAG: hypothetical protein V4666_02695 [Bacteroidota bacterium]
MENKRFAISTGITISSNLVNACLSMLAIIGAIFIFIIEKRETTVFFYISIFFSFSSFITSIIYGSKGINLAREKAFDGKLKLKYTKKHFNFQAITCAVGIILCILSIFFTKERKESNIELEKINGNLEKFIELDKSRSKNTDSLLLEINNLKGRIERLENKK